MPSLVDDAKEVLGIIYPRSAMVREQRVDMAITDDGRPRADRATGELAPEARPIFDAEQIAVEGVDAANLQEMLDTLDLDGIQAQIDLKAPLASPTFTGTLTAADLVATGNTTLGNAGGDITLIQGHLKHKGSAPSIAVGAALGTGGSVGVTIAGTDDEGELTVTAGTTSLGAGTAATITFATARPDTNYTVIVSPRASVAGLNAEGAYGTRDTTGQWLLRFATAPASGTARSYCYRVREWTN